MKASVLFLIVFFTAVFVVFLIKTPSVSISTGSVAAAKEASLTVESFYIYVILVGFAVIICALFWHFNRFFDREESLQKRNKLK